MLKLSQVLAEFRARYTPVAGSPVIDKGDPADGAGVDIGAIEAPGGPQRPDDKLGKYGVASKDVEPPKVSLASPASGAALAGRAKLVADASDNVGVFGVQFFVDGVNFGEALAAPYAVSFDSAILANGNHTITVKAWDAAGNSTDAGPVTVSVRNGGAAPAMGPATATQGK
jgi:hypothetical protein